MLDGFQLVDVHLHAASKPSLKLPWDTWTQGFGGDIERLYDEARRIVPARASFWRCGTSPTILSRDSSDWVKAIATEVLSACNAVVEFEPSTRSCTCAGKPARCSSGRKFLQGGVDIVDFNRLVEIDLAHEGAAILLDLEKPHIFQCAKRLSDRTAADTETFGDLLFGELLTSG